MDEKLVTDSWCVSILMEQAFTSTTADATFSCYTYTFKEITISSIKASVHSENRAPLWGVALAILPCQSWEKTSGRGNWLWGGNVHSESKPGLQRMSSHLSYQSNAPEVSILQRFTQWPHTAEMGHELWNQYTWNGWVLRDPFPACRQGPGNRTSYSGTVHPSTNEYKLERVLLRVVLMVALDCVVVLSAFFFI